MSKYFFCSSLNDIKKSDWNECVGNDHPFLQYEFLHALEESKSANTKTGWQSYHYIEKENDKIISLCPLYIKNHSFGEYIFDHSWADAYHRYGINYYPKLQSAINRIFSPEFRNRIDSIIHFNHLSKNIVLSIVDKFIIEIEAQLEDKGVSLSINKEAKELLAEEGYDEIYGARELGRVIQEKVKKPMAEELIFGKLSKGGHVEITCKDKKISFEFSNKQEVKKELA